MGKLYIAYGSNLNLAQMSSRCPSASIYAKGILNNWELVFRGSKTNAHATIIKKQGSIIPVLIWEIEPKDEQHLDIYEGYPHYYIKKNLMVTVEGQKKKAMIYIMNPKYPPGKPSNQYIQTILQGYMDNNMDINILIKSLKMNYKECII